MDGQMEWQLSLYPLTCMCCWKGVEPSTRLKISPDPCYFFFLVRRHYLRVLNRTLEP